MSGGVTYIDSVNWPTVCVRGRNLYTDSMNRPTLCVRGCNLQYVYIDSVNRPTVCQGALLISRFREPANCVCQGE